MKTEFNAVPKAFCNDDMRAISSYKSYVFDGSMEAGAIIMRLVELENHKDNKEKVEKFCSYTGYSLPFVDVSDDEIKAMIAKMDEFGEKIATLQAEHEKRVEAMNNDACKVIREELDYDKALAGVTNILVKRDNDKRAFESDVYYKSKTLSSFGLIFGVIERSGKDAAYYTGEGNTIAALPFDEKMISRVPSHQYQPLKASYDIYSEYYQAISSVVAYFDKYQDDKKNLDIVKTYFGTSGESLRNSLTIDEFIKKSQEVDKRQNELDRLINMKA